jgi:hypothetical protein
MTELHRRQLFNCSSDPFPLPFFIAARRKITGEPMGIIIYVNDNQYYKEIGGI